MDMFPEEIDNDLFQSTHPARGATGRVTGRSTNPE